MTGNAIAKVDAPRQRRGIAKRAIVEPCQKTADAPNHHADDQRQHKIIACGARLADQFFADLYTQ